MERHDEPHRTHITRALGDPKRLLPWHKSCCFWMTPHGRDPVGSKRSSPPDAGHATGVCCFLAALVLQREVVRCAAIYPRNRKRISDALTPLTAFFARFAQAAEQLTSKTRWAAHLTNIFASIREGPAA